MSLQSEQPSASSDSVEYLTTQAAPEHAIKASADIASEKPAPNYNAALLNAPHENSSGRAALQVPVAAKPVDADHEVDDKTKDCQNATKRSGPQPHDEKREAKERDQVARAEESKRLHSRQMVADDHWHVQDRSSGG